MIDGKNIFDDQLIKRYINHMKKIIEKLQQVKEMTTQMISC